MKKILFIIAIFSSTLILGQAPQKSSTQSGPSYPYSSLFRKAYMLHPKVPKGVLEAVSFTMTHINHIDSTTPQSCTGMPRAYGVMGLILDGKGYFRENLKTVSRLSGISADNIINSPEANILAFASAYENVYQQLKIRDNRIEEQVAILKALSEIPDDTLQSDYPLNAYIYSVLKFLSNPAFQKQYNFPGYRIDFIKVFGAVNYQVLSARKVIRLGDTYRSEEGATYINFFKK